MAETVRIDPASHTALTEIAKAKAIPLTEALRQAVERYRREVFLEDLVTAMATFRREHPEEAAEDDKETALWDTTSSDGLDNEPPYPLDGLGPVAAPMPPNRKRRKAAR